MRILYIPLPGSDPMYDGFYNSLKKGHEVDWYWDCGPVDGFDVVHLQSGAITSDELEMIRGGSMVTQWTGDYRPEAMEMVTQYDVDITFMAADVPEIYPGVRWLPHGVDDWQFRPVRGDADGVVMIANRYDHFPGGRERTVLHNVLKKRDDYTSYGSGYGKQVDWKITPDIYNKARFATGGNIYNNAKLYFSNRPLWAMAAGTCYIMRRVPGIERYFTNGVHCYLWDEPEQVEDIINFTTSDIRDQIARNGQRRVRELFHWDEITKMYINEIFRKN